MDEQSDTVEGLDLRWRGSAKWLQTWWVVTIGCYTVLTSETHPSIAVPVLLAMAALTLLIRSSLHIGPDEVRFTTTFARPLRCAPGDVAGYFVERGSVIDTPRRA